MTAGAVTIMGPCIPKGRPRLNYYGRVFTPKRTRDYETLVAETVRPYVKEPLTGGLALTIEVIKAPPVSWSKKRRREAQELGLFNAKRPDLDNYTKSILDGLNGILYKDDAQVSKITVSKRYGAFDCVIVSWEEVAHAG